MGLFRALSWCVFVCGQMVCVCICSSVFLHACSSHGRHSAFVWFHVWMFVNVLYVSVLTKVCASQISTWMQVFLVQLQAITSPPHVKRKPLIAVNILTEWITDRLYTQLVQILKTNGPENSRGGRERGRRSEGERQRERSTHILFHADAQTLTHAIDLVNF